MLLRIGRVVLRVVFRVDRDLLILKNGGKLARLLLMVAGFLLLLMVAKFLLLLMVAGFLFLLMVAGFLLLLLLRMDRVLRMRVVMD